MARAERNASFACIVQSVQRGRSWGIAITIASHTHTLSLSHQQPRLPPPPPPPPPPSPPPLPPDHHHHRRRRHINHGTSPSTQPVSELSWAGGHKKDLVFPAHGEALVTPTGLLGVTFNNVRPEDRIEDCPALPCTPPHPILFTLPRPPSRNLTLPFCSPFSRLDACHWTTSSALSPFSRRRWWPRKRPADLHRTPSFPSACMHVQHVILRAQVATSSTRLAYIHFHWTPSGPRVL